MNFPLELLDMKVLLVIIKILQAKLFLYKVHGEAV